MTLNEITQYIKPYVLNAEGTSYGVLYLLEGEELSEGLCMGDISVKEVTGENSSSEYLFEGLPLEKAIEICISQEVYLDHALIDAIGCFDSKTLREMANNKFDFSKQYGKKARCWGRNYEVKVLQRFENNWFLGTVNESRSVFSTESVETYRTEEEAIFALRTHNWTQVEFKTRTPSALNGPESVSEVLDSIAEFVRNSQYRENQSSYGYGWQETAFVVDSDEVIDFIDSLRGEK